MMSFEQTAARSAPGFTVRSAAAAAGPGPPVAASCSRKLAQGELVVRTPVGTAAHVRAGPGRRRPRRVSFFRLAARARRAARRRRRLRRSLHRRSLDDARSAGAPDAARAQRGGDRARVSRHALAAMAFPPAALAQCQHEAAGEAQHRRPLRPRQRLLPTVARSDDDLFVGAVRRRLGRPLAVAQRAKYERILAELALSPGARMLEIGCGWGGFAETAARARLSRHRPFALRRADGVRPRAHRAGRTRGPRDAAIRTIATTQGSLRPRRLDRDVRGGRRA